MKVIILCGGQGTRLKEETEFKPKPMVYVGNNPILWHIMKMYSYYGFNEFILALGYKGDYIKQFFLNQKALTSDFTLQTKNYEAEYHLENRAEVDDFKITFVDTGLETMPGERILRCKKYIPKNDDTFMVTYGDGVSDIDIKKLLKFHKKQKTIGTITGIHPISKFGVVLVNKKNIVEEFSEKPVMNDWVNGGYMVFNKEFFKYLKSGETEHPALRRLAKKGKLSLYKHEGFWACMDTNKELKDLNTWWSEPNPPWKIWK
ncbi:MAG: sugar phosphate nucleotidyltransferase [Candidatus Shapirobacteria bacterium]|nr:sugar phosphate nucleotidyltransferase [Candidatus Shapirobacteria bacterium]